MNTKPTLICVLGPTASGKTAAAIKLAQKLNTEIISADSRQFYKEISIGTAKPSFEELAQVQHHFIGHISITQNYSAGDFEREAIQKIEQFLLKHKVLVLVGGSGLYVKAIYDGLHPLPKANEILRNELDSLFANEGIEALQTLLQQLDVGRWETIDKLNPQRLMRAIEIAKAEEGSFTQLIQNQIKQRPFNTIKIALDLPREELYECINQRVERMLEQGLVDEAKAMLPFKATYALQTVGYKELFDYFDGFISHEKAVELIKQHTRNYAKKQLTWLRKEKGIQWIHPRDVSDFANKCLFAPTL